VGKVGSEGEDLRIHKETVFRNLRKKEDQVVALVQVEGKH
jgi:hypothetical protein